MIFRRSVVSVMFILAMATAVMGLSKGGALVENDFRGTWRNVDPETRGISSLVVRREGDDLTVQAWGKCHPTDCDWGVVPFRLIGDSTRDITFDYAFAKWEFDFAATYLTMKMRGDQLVAETITVFSDNSNRSHYRNILLLKRAED